MTEYNDNLHKNSKASAFENARGLRKTQTKAEEKLWEVLRNCQVCNLKFRRQHAFDNYILDFYCHKMKLAVEVDGEVHNDPEVAAYDEARTRNLNENGLTVLRFSNNEIEFDIAKVVKKIEAWFEENDFVEFSGSSAPLSLRRGVGGEVNRLDKAFSQNPKNILNIFCTAGYPQLDSTLTVMKALQDNGADIIELGMPYSDPLADGLVIQESSHIALENGMTIGLLFEQLQHFRADISVPVVLMGYMNPVLQYGFEHFCAAAAAVGVDGIILPDLPMHEFETEYKAIFEKYKLKLIFLVTPETGEDRIRKIDSLSSGFIYAVSSSSTTGNSQVGLENKGIEAQQPYFKQLHDMQLKNPFLVGFGIKDAASFEAACRHSSGAIIGSAYINALKANGSIQQITKEFLNGIRD